MIDLYGPDVLIVIPTLNERDHIGPLMEQRLAELDRISGHIVVADGGSTDGTIEIAKTIARRDRRVIVLHNPWRIQSAAVNLAVERFGEGCEFVIRVDAHGGYPADYCAALVGEAITR
jgi:succinoglycan biosynthesis protein ExoA